MPAEILNLWVGSISFVLISKIPVFRFQINVTEFITQSNPEASCIAIAFNNYKIATDSILYIEGLKDYIRVHTNTEKIIVLENMKDILTKLPENRFVRIHRSYIIPLNKIRVIEGNQIQMSNGEYLSIGETYRKLIGEWIDKK